MLGALLLAAALPVWAEGLETTPNTALVFEGSFTAENGPPPLLKLAAAYGCKIYLNDAFAGYGPARGPEGKFRVDEWLLTAAKAGMNRLRIESVGQNLASYYWMDQPSFVQAEVVQKGRTRLVSQEMTVRRLETYVDTKTRYSFQRTWKEAYHVGGSPHSAPLKLATSAPRATLPRYCPYPVFEILKTKPDGAFFDAGRNASGFLIVRIHAKSAGRMCLVWDEMLSRDKKTGKPSINATRLGARSGLDIEIAAPGDYTVETHEPYTGRYFGYYFTGAITAEPPEIRLYENPEIRNSPRLKAKGPYAEVVQAAAVTLAQNAVDCLTDCPSRERAGWLCDSWFEGRAERFFTGDNKVEKSFLENYAEAPIRAGCPSYSGVPAGMVAMCYPANHDAVRTKGAHFIPNWAMWLVLEVEDYAARSGDRAMIAKMKPALSNVLQYFRMYENADGLLADLPGWVFVEWSRANSFTKGVNYPTNMLYAEMLDAYGRMYSDRSCAAKARKLRETIRAQSFDGMYFKDCNGSNEKTETCQYYAFFTHTADAKSDAQLWQTMVDKTFKGLYPSNMFIGHYLRWEVLKRAGRTDLIRAELPAHLKHQIETTGTLWEHDKPSASCCHGFAAYAACLLSE